MFIIFWDFLKVEQIIEVKRSVIISNKLVYIGLKILIDFHTIKNVLVTYIRKKG